MVHGMRSYWKLSPVVAAGLLVLLAGCGSASSGDQDAPPPAPPAASSVAPPPAPPAVRPAAPAAPPAVPGPIAGLRPMSTAERQQRDFCQQGILKNGCEFYTDDSLRLQGIDPDS